MVVVLGISQVTKITLEDFNNNGWIDIVNIGDASNSVIVYINNSTSFTANIIDSF